MHTRQQYSYYKESTIGGLTTDGKEGGAMEDSMDEAAMAMQLEEEQIALMAMQRDLYKIKMRKNKPSSGASSFETGSTYSVKSFGDESTYKEIMEKDIEDEVKWIYIEFIIDIILLIIIILVLALTKKRQHECGIPVREWIMAFFIIWLSKSTLNLFKIPVLRNNYENRLNFTAALFVVMNGFLVIWLIVGNVYWFSDSNDCADHDDTQWLNITMLVILIIGYVVIFIYFLLLCTVPCIYFYSNIHNQQNREGDRLVRPHRGNTVTRTLSRTGFDPQVYI